MKHHLAIFAPNWIDLIFDGKKTIESRFTQVRCAPFRKVNAGDIIFMKEREKLVLGACRVGKVETFENLTKRQIYQLYYEHHDAVFTTCWKDTRINPMPPAKWLDAKYATLIYLTNPVQFPVPFAIQKRCRRAWVCYDALADFLALVSTPTQEVIAQCIDLYNPL